MIPKNRMSAVLVAYLLLSFFNFSFSRENPALETELTRKIDKGKKFSKEEKKAARAYPSYYQIDPASIKVELKEVKEDDQFNTPTPVKGKDVEIALVNLEKVVNIALKIWEIVKDNAPVVNIENKYAVAYPEGITSASQLQNWKKPRIYIYSFYANNLYGVRVIDVEYRVIFNYGGNYKGKGKFLTGVSIVPTMVDVAWGYRFNMSSYVPDSTVVNVSTSENPLAALQLKLTWKISTYLKDSTGTSVYYIQGDGYFSEIASPFKVKDKERGLINTLAEKTPEKVF